MNDFANVLSNLDLDIEVKRRISLNLNRIVEGISDAYITPIGKDRNPLDILRKFDAVFNSRINDMNKPLKDLESSNRERFGPRSKTTGWKERKHTLLESFEAEKLNDSGLELVSLKGNSRLRPITKENAMVLLKNSTNSGLPYYTKKGNVKERVLLKYEYLLKRKDPCLLFTRSQEQMKTRDV